MTGQRRYKTQSILRQRGAVAIIVAICIFVLVGFLGLVIDLGHLYVAKTELQNAADAAALSGAKELVGTVTGVNDAKDRAIEAAGKNNYDLNATAVVIDDGDLQFSSSPDGPWVDIADALASPGDKTFLKVDTGLRNLDTWFIRVLVSAMTQTSTFGMAVAGRLTTNITPLGICAIDPAATNRELGFLRGVAYNAPNINPLAVQPDQLWINPIDVYPGGCDPNNAAPANTFPFVCTGTMSSISAIPGKVYYDTGNDTTLNGPLNSRFGVATAYTGGHSCNPDTAPADSNVREYNCTRTGGPNPDNCLASGSLPSNSPRDWMDPSSTTLPTRQSMEIRLRTDPIAPRKPFNYPTRLAPEIPADFSRYGVLWSYSKELNFSTTPATTRTTADWPNLYGGSAQTYPPTTTPYLAYITPPTGLGATHATADRRVLNMLIMDCDAEVEHVGACTALPVIGVGRFFMQVQADLPNNLHVEFAGLLPTPLPPADIRLFR